jgi:hypothetical protein
MVPLAHITADPLLSRLNTWERNQPQSGETAILLLLGSVWIRELCVPVAPDQVRWPYIGTRAACVHSFPLS